MKFDKLKVYDNFYWKRVSGAKLIGKYDMPVLKPVHNVVPRNLVPFHSAKNCKSPQESWYHYYEDDYQFERFWNRPKKYFSILERFEGGISPDYSIYLDMPKSQQIWNCWRNRAITYYMQKHGLLVIPNVGWGDTESLSWAFDGIPEKSVLSITTRGCLRNGYLCKQSLLNGLHELIRIKKPEKLIVYGQFPENWKHKFPNIITTLKTFVEEKWRK